jgi:hypothetical protein
VDYSHYRKRRDISTAANAIDCWLCLRLAHEMPPTTHMHTEEAKAEARAGETWYAATVVVARID